MRCRIVPPLVCLVSLTLWGSGADPRAWAQETPRPFDKSGAGEPAQDQLKGAAIAPYILPDAVLAISARPRQAILRSETKGDSALLFWETWEREHELIPPMASLTHMIRILGMELADVDELGFVAQAIQTRRRPDIDDAPRAPDSKPENPNEPAAAEDAAPAPVRRSPDVPPAPVRRNPLEEYPVRETYLLRFARPIVVSAALVRGTAPQSIAGVKYFGRGKDNLFFAVTQPDENTVVFGQETYLRQALANEDHSSALARAAATLDPRDDLAIMVSAQGLLPTMPKMEQEFLRGTSLARAAFRFGAEPSGKASLLCTDEDEAARWSTQIEGGIKLLGGLGTTIVAAAERGKAPPATQLASAEAAKFLEAVGPKLRVRTKGRRVDVDWPADAGAAIDFEWTALFSTFQHVVVESDNPDDEPRREFKRVWFDPAAAKEQRTKRGAVAEDAVGAALRREFVAAAAMDPMELFAAGEAEKSPEFDDFRDKRLSVLWLAFGSSDKAEEVLGPDRKPGARPGRKTTPPSPHAIANRMSEKMHFGYAPLIHWEDITRMTVKVNGDRADGMIEYDAFDIWAGHVKFFAEKSNAGWRFTQFWLPSGQTVALHRDGVWKSLGSMKRE